MEDDRPWDEDDLVQSEDEDDPVDQEGGDNPVEYVTVEVSVDDQVQTAELLREKGPDLGVEESLAMAGLGLLIPASVPMLLRMFGLT